MRHQNPSPGYAHEHFYAKIEFMNRIAVIGGGAWGTALAQACRANGRETVLWALEAEVVEAVNHDHENSVYLPGIALDDGLRASTDLAVAADVELVLLVTPAQHLRSITTQLANHLPAGVPAVICAKGVEKGSFALMSEVLAETLPEAPPVVLSGPTFAKEVAVGLPTAVTLAAGTENMALEIGECLGRPHFRPYFSQDIIGAQIGGAMKNVMAVACGIVEGKQMGENARAALMTRGLAELTRYGLARGAQLETLMGLSGIGDLSLTCNSLQSRNMSFGADLGKGKTAAEIMAERNSVAEGVHTAAAVAAEAQAKNIDMPIALTVDQIANQGADLDDAIASLLNRPFQAEFHG